MENERILYPKPTVQPNPTPLVFALIFKQVPLEGIRNITQVTLKGRLNISKNFASRLPEEAEATGSVSSSPKSSCALWYRVRSAMELKVRGGGEGEGRDGSS